MEQTLDEIAHVTFGASRHRRSVNFPRNRARSAAISNLCQICVRPLLIWTFWQIWGDEGTVSYVESMRVGVPIPSRATTF